jgi:hypothetical protein
VAIRGEIWRTPGGQTVAVVQTRFEVAVGATLVNWVLVQGETSLQTTDVMPPVPSERYAYWPDRHVKEFSHTLSDVGVGWAVWSWLVLQGRTWLQTRFEVAVGADFSKVPTPHAPRTDPQTRSEVCVAAVVSYWLGPQAAECESHTRSVELVGAMVWNSEPVQRLSTVHSRSLVVVPARLW